VELADGLTHTDDLDCDLSALVVVARKINRAVEASSPGVRRLATSMITSLGVGVAIADQKTQIGTVTQDDDLDAAGVLLDDTTEIRWIAEGHLPSDVEAWFTRGGTTGVVEERCDTYRIDGRAERGVKLRFRETLEVKVRQAVGEYVIPGLGLIGRVEMWRKWSPVEGVVDTGGEVPWLDVCKIVIKRRFFLDGDGDEILPSNLERATTGAGCDVEVAAITVGDIEAWTFAFAAFGPTSSREHAIVTAWQALVADGSCPERLAAAFGPSSSYPEWLAPVARSGGVARPSELFPRRSCDLIGVVARS